MSLPAVVISAAVEGDLDEAILRRLVEEAGGQVGTVYGKRGKSHLLQRLSGYNRAALHGPWLVLVDLDRDADCAPDFCAEHLPRPAPGLCLRVAVRSVEAWLLADGAGLASLLSVPRSRIPSEPEGLPDPKRTLVELARQSRRRLVREEMVPREGSGRSVGPLYTANLSEFVSSAWDPDAAAVVSESLRRCRQRLRELVGRRPRTLT